jgi:hypothetical protein
MTPRRHHYVWQKYLKPWTTKVGKAQQLWCLRKGQAEPFCTDTTNVAVERDFYRVHDFETSDADFIRAVAFRGNTNPTLHKLNEGWITGFESIFALISLAKSHSRFPQEGLSELDRFLIEYQESWQSRIETEAADLIPRLLLGDTQFFENEADATRFCHFVAHQYFRTKAIRDGVRSAYVDLNQEQRFDRTWPVLRNIFATNLSFALFMDRHSVPLQIIRAPVGVRFLTSDQPAINTYAANAPRNAAVSDMETYYPISPEIAVIFSERPSYRGIHRQILEPELVSLLNQAIAAEAHEQMFSATEGELRNARFRD